MNTGKVFPDKPVKTITVTLKVNDVMYDTSREYEAFNSAAIAKQLTEDDYVAFIDEEVHSYQADADEEDEECTGRTCECMQDYPIDPTKVRVVSDEWIRNRYSMPIPFRAQQDYLESKCVKVYYQLVSGDEHTLTWFTKTNTRISVSIWDQDRTKATIFTNGATLEEADLVETLASIIEYNENRENNGN